jgi:hypothetical protein
MTVVEAAVASKNQGAVPHLDPIILRDNNMEVSPHGATLVGICTLQAFKVQGAAAWRAARVSFTIQGTILHQEYWSASGWNRVSPRCSLHTAFAKRIPDCRQIDHRFGKIMPNIAASCRHMSKYASESVDRCCRSRVRRHVYQAYCRSGWCDLRSWFSSMTAALSRHP